MNVHCPACTPHWTVDCPGVDPARLQKRVDSAEAKLESLGYRRCDIAACNCGGWHLYRLFGLRDLSTETGST